jgi:hypothetical protein
MSCPSVTHREKLIEREEYEDSVFPICLIKHDVTKTYGKMERKMPTFLI